MLININSYKGYGVNNYVDNYVVNYVVIFLFAWMIICSDIRTVNHSFLFFPVFPWILFHYL